MQMQELGMSSGKRVRPLTDAEIAEVVGSMTQGQAMSAASKIVEESGGTMEMVIQGSGAGDDWDVRTSGSQVIVFRGSSSS